MPQQNLDLIPAARLVEEARKLIGVPFKHQGRNEFGVDCLGMPVVAARKAGFREIPKILMRTDYGRHPTENLLRQFEAQCVRIAAPVHGCVVLMAMNRSNPWPHHVGIFAADGGAGAGSIIHADAVLKRVIEVAYRAKWKDRYPHSYWKLPGFDYS